jgi:cytochrome c-type biogenesis protein CcsB
MIIDIPALEALCANSCFVILFLNTLYYWFKIIFAGESPYTQTGLFGFGSAVFCLTSQLILRWVDSGHFPLSNLYESLLFLAWCLLILYIYIETSTKTLFLGVLTSPAVLCLVTFTDFSLPPELQRSSPLVPSLQSNWLIMHVTVMIASYAALLLGCLVAIAYLIFNQFFQDPKQSTKLDSTQIFFGGAPENSFSSLNYELRERGEQNIFFETPAETSLVTDFNGVPKYILGEETQLLSNSSVNVNGDLLSVFDKPNLQNKMEQSSQFLRFLDNLSYRTIGIGFCFLTLGILSGAVWANETWGNYWSWDPKETWAFITWLTFASYLHSRLIGGWTGSKPAWIAGFGFIIVWVCYLGVNLLGQGLHSYGFLEL